MVTLLVDNGSLRAASYLNLRKLAVALGVRVGEAVLPTSLLHSSKIDPVELGGQPALTWERAVRAHLERGHRHFYVVPFFIGPSGAMVDYLPERLAKLRQRCGPIQMELAPFLYDPTQNDLLDLLADQVQATIQAQGLECPPVVLCDHGSPKPAVTEVRNTLATQLAGRLGKAVRAVAPASMERRDGPEYAFNEPLLEHQLDLPGFDQGDVVVAMLFLNPGRHAGPEGDVASICRAAEARHSGLRCHQTPLLGQHPGMIDLLQARFEAGRSAPHPL